MKRFLVMAQKGITLVTLVVALAILLILVSIVLGTLRRSASPASVSASKAASGPPKSPRPPFKTLVVEMAIEERSYNEGREYMRSTGRAFKYLDIAGNRRREDLEETKTILGSEKIVAGTLIFDGKTAYGFEKGNTKGFSTSVGAEGWIAWKEGYLAYLDEGLRKDLARKGSGAAASHARPLVGEEFFLGRSCQLFRSDYQKEWIWHGILLKSETGWKEPPSTGIHGIEQAVSVEENVDIDESRFHPPEDVTFEPLKQTVAQSLVSHPWPPWVQSVHVSRH